MANGRQPAGGGPTKYDKKLLDAAGAVAKVWLETEGTTGHKRLDNSLQRLVRAYRDWAGHQPERPPAAAR